MRDSRVLWLERQVLRSRVRGRMLSRETSGTKGRGTILTEV